MIQLMVRITDDYISINDFHVCVVTPIHHTIVSTNISYQVIFRR